MHRFSVHKNYFLYAFIAITVIVLTFNCSHINRGLVRMVQHIHPQAFFFIDTERKMVALTIDDSPHPQTTWEILQVLEQFDAKATFFVISDSVNGREDIVRQIVQAGHEIGNHMTGDTPSYRLKPQVFRKRFTEADSVLAQYDSVRWFRPASGLYTYEMVSYLSQSHPGYHMALGSVYPIDAAIGWSDFAVMYIKLNISSGDIIILHDGGQRGRRTVETLGRILPYLKEKGYEVVTLSRLLSASSKEYNHQL